MCRRYIFRVQTLLSIVFFLFERTCSGVRSEFDCVNQKAMHSGVTQLPAQTDISHTGCRTHLVDQNKLTLVLGMLGLTAILPFSARVVADVSLHL